MIKEKAINLSSNRIIRRTLTDDSTMVSNLIEQGKAKMFKAGNPNQWSANYPAESTIGHDIAQGDCYLLYECEKPIVTFVAKAGLEPSYHRIDNGSWLDDQPYYVVHRVASEEDVHGVMADIINYCSAFTSSIRIDTHVDNRPIQASSIRSGFVYCGIIYVENGDSRLAFQCIF